MKTRFSSLVTIKKNTVQKGERVVQNANNNLDRASTALELSKKSLNSIEIPQNGTMSDFLASRTLLDSGRNIIRHNQEWLDYSTNQLNLAKEQLKRDMLEYEKFKFLNLQEIKKIIKKQKIQEAKDLDEVALMTYAGKNKLVNIKKERAL